MGCVKSKPICSPVKVDSNDIEKNPKLSGVSNTVDEDYEEANQSSRTVLTELMDTLQNTPLFERANTCVDVVTADIAAIETIYDGVKDGPILGYGITGVVRKCTHKETGAEFALKSLSLKQIETTWGLEQLKEELMILMQLDHPNIVKLEAVYESEDEIFLIQELLNGGDLFDHLDAQPEEHYSEAQCARLVKQMLSALRYIHSKGIIHRDLKLENFLFAGPEGEMKMIDFGLSKHFKSGSKHHEPVGTRYTVAPEVILGDYDEKADVWAIGVITYLLLSGDSPFGGCSDHESLVEIRRNILTANFSFEPLEYWDHVSDVGKEFISQILVTNPANRPSASECQSHPWMQEWVNKENDGPLSINVQKAMNKFKGFSDIRKLLCEVIGFTLLPDQITELRKEFEKLDAEQTGEISLSNLEKVLLKNPGNNEALCALVTEGEVEDMFNSLRLHKADTTIHWHHFLAAGLSECAVDERNHRLAFDKLDHEKKGYITFEDVVDLAGPETLKRSLPSLKKEWGDSVCSHGPKVNFQDFVKVMSPIVETEAGVGN